MRHLLVLSVVCSAAIPAGAQNLVAPISSGATPLTPAEKYEWHLRRAFRPLKLAQVGLGAAWAQSRDIPHEWPQGAGGYGQRYAAGLAMTTTRSLMAASFHSTMGTDPRYRRSTLDGFGPRLGYAIKWTFLTRKDDGGSMPAIPRFASAYGAAFLATRWLPESRSSTPRALGRGSTAIAFDVVNNIISEFAPDLLRKLKKRK